MWCSQKKKKKGTGDVIGLLDFSTGETGWGRVEEWLSRGSNEDQGVG